MKNYFKLMREITSSKLIVLVAIFLIAFGNRAFFSNVSELYPVNQKNMGFLFSLVWVFGGSIVLLLSLVCYRFTIKPTLTIVLLLSSFVSYFMDTYNTVIDDAMIQNILNTDLAESLDLFNVKLLGYIAFLGILPSFLVYKTKIVFRPLGQEIISRLMLFLVALFSMLAVALIFSDFYSSFFREHKPLRYYANPGYYVYSSGRYLKGFFKSSPLVLRQVGLDAKIPSSDMHKELVIFVVGESARSDRFSLNGYAKETNPLLKKEDVISFTNYWSCGTSTAVSVPCMFSTSGSAEFNNEAEQSTENVLDVLKRAEVQLLWRDNNSDSKGVAERISYQSYKEPDVNPVCDIECRDEGMLEGLQDYIDGHEQGDIFIVLHQMGNHGPAYYKRYPSEFEKFTPVCKTNQLEDCSKEEINNAYDNAILYTDYFLSKVIELLKQNDQDFETVLFYVSDHGESLGEKGLYLHGLPNFFAPDTQRHVPAIIWFGDTFDDVDRRLLAKKRNHEFTHDHVSHTILGLMEIKTSIYDRRMDILQSAQ